MVKKAVKKQTPKPNENDGIVTVTVDFNGGSVTSVHEVKNANGFLMKKDRNPIGLCRVVLSGIKGRLGGAFK